MNVPVRRSLAAAAGAAVGVAGWLVTERLRHPGDALFGPNPADAAMAGAIYVAPILAAALAGWALAARRPATSSALFACAVALAGIAGAAGVFAGVAAAGQASPLHFVLAFAWVLVFGTIRVGPAALAAGWLTTYLADRWAARA